jgi:hypothetical protein
VGEEQFPPLRSLDAFRTWIIQQGIDLRPQVGATFGGMGTGPAPCRATLRCRVA